jgi:hypothetical protein
MSCITRLTEPMLVHTSRGALVDSESAWGASCTSNPSSRRCADTSRVDSLLVLLQRRNGTPESCRRRNASTGCGVGVDPTCRVPEMSIRSARRAGRGRVACIRGGSDEAACVWLQMASMIGTNSRYGRFPIRMSACEHHFLFWNRLFLDQILADSRLWGLVLIP